MKRKESKYKSELLTTKIKDEKFDNLLRSYKDKLKLFEDKNILPYEYIYSWDFEESENIGISQDCIAIIYEKLESL